MTIKVFFDIDGTLTKEESTWRLLLKNLDVDKKSNANFEKWKNHRDAGQWTKDDLELLNELKITPEQVNEILDIDNIKKHLRKGVIGTFNQLEIYNSLNEPIEIYLLSSSFGLYVEAIANLLNIPDENVFQNKIHYNNSIWETDKYKTFKDKGEIIRCFLKDGDTIITIGNGFNDIEMFKEANISIGVGIDDKNLSLLKPYMNINFTEEDGSFSPFISMLLFGVPPFRDGMKIMNLMIDSRIGR